MAPDRDPKTRSRRPRRDAEANRERVLLAAVHAVRREGPKVPMATIAADADVGVGTVYRHFPTREDLLAALSARSFGIVLENLRIASEAGPRAGDRVAAFLDATITRRAELVLPLHGGPVVADAAVLELRRQVGRAVEALLAPGVADGSLRADLTAGDVVLFGAMLAEPLATVTDWDAIARRQARIYVDGIAGPDRVDD
ncbi:TetR/AcrR family transcriptional regulator [Patulibacter sp. NPDC049589]|uniref:TetR/AcrR family transcriptional regulator n=1 Tax=Patulibacter sp. NPDC049589 TaxID=3154731 RepID=UPI003425C27C